MKKLLVFAIAILGFSAVSFGQINVATATVGATIITPISITKVTDMNFGTVLVTGAGTATLVPGSAATYSGVSHYSNTNAVTATTAKFTVNGNFGNTYGISVSGLPATVVNGSANMALSAWSVGGWTGTAGTMTFTEPTAAGTGTLSGTGAQTFEIGATLTLVAGQTAGVYAATAPMTVTVNYN